MSLKLKMLLVLCVAGVALIGIGAMLQQDGGSAATGGAVEPEVAEHGEADASEAAPLSLAARTEQALLDQVSCRQPPAAGVALQAMIKSGLVQETGDRADGAVVFRPTWQLRLLGFPIVRITGWEPGEERGAMSPFYRAPGTAPPNFISVTVRGAPDDVRRKVLEQGMRQQEYVPDPSRQPYEPEGEVRRPRKLIPGILVEARDLYFVERPLNGVTTLTCSASEYDFEAR